jgi:hypothetical protein
MIWEGWYGLSSEYNLRAAVQMGIGCRHLIC